MAENTRIAKKAVWWNAQYATGRYRREWEYSYPSQELVGFVAAARLRPGTAALDVGCRAGGEAIFLAQCGLTVIGVDFSEAAIRIARRRALALGLRVSWHVADVLDIPLESKSVDVVNDRGCFHIIRSRERRRFANEIARVL